MKFSLFLLMLLSWVLVGSAVNLLGRPLQVLGAFFKGLKARRSGAVQGGDLIDPFEGTEEIDRRNQELEAQNEVLRDQVRQLKRLANKQNEVQRRLRFDKEQLHRLLETTVHETEVRLSEQFMLEKTEALRELEEKHESERAKWKKELVLVKAELGVKSKALDNALESVAELKQRLKNEAARYEKETKTVSTPPLSVKKKRENSAMNSSDEESLGAGERRESSSNREKRVKKLKVSNERQR
jgi:hypothetical protein